MSETLDSFHQSAPDAGSGVGPTLRELRLARSCTLNEASTRLKFSVRQLEALEAQEWDQLPGGQPLRGMVRNYARFLQADVSAVLVMLEAQVSDTAAPKPVPRSPSGSGLGKADLSLYADSRGGFGWVWILIIVVLLLVAGFYAIDRGWVPQEWLVFDWLKDLKK
ncbi:helix-turn-helix domain-containing protein [Alcaligenes ammonioxydans]|jgi:cytoskeleton protein RodZ|uniref:Helix-turn-helix domain-containing protein n=1 Tax=Alcaligenes ammonioxydans TaxID=2582914 RepID=A0ABX8STW1_9BURK|nr:helix-turn-helix transcriptional regulator [Alcaligenes ammonioxydans]EJC65304.1 membrane protein [Alcaligenes faecalis subsp. faecalis NCIB 8687]QBH18302.1 helix-turn-helix domain-containing protein [Alcaligenes faecalis]MCH1878154.1 helix-turn-helix domain-containing protein [Alcaligenes ammonioxydans]QXX79456.1 helix-turn-helix domain-containing protein [Alcaligenes ammonioxydans]WGQ34381.1 helix-turn-helix transcriptional regulator [Alcaligenes faecalis]